MLPSFCRDVITVRRAPLVRSTRGADVRDWSRATDHKVSGCSVQPGETTTDMTSPRDGNGLVRFSVLAPPGSDVADGDRVLWEGREYELNGAPQTWRSPTGRVSHMTFSLVSWKG